MFMVPPPRIEHIAPSENSQKFNNNIMIPITQTIQYNVVKFDVNPTCVVTLNQQVSLVVNFQTDHGMNIAKTVVLTGQDYNNWGADDAYIYEYVRNNVSQIFNGSV